MKLFVKKLCCLISILALCCAALVSLDFFVGKERRQENYQAAIVDKLERLKSIDEPKIILVGHSNLAFGMDSKQLEEALSMPVVNLGLHGGLGNAFHENAAKANIGEGDIVVVCHSSFGKDNVDGVLSCLTVSISPETIHFFEEGYWDFIQAYPGYWRKNMGGLILDKIETDSEETCYARNAFNEYGDVVLKPQSGQVHDESYFEKNRVYVPEIDQACVERLNEYNDYVTSKGASLVVAGYPIAYGKYATFTESDFENFKDQLQKALDCEVISDYTDYFFPYSYFYDTKLHLTQEGASARTVQLIKDLKAWKEVN